ncbi:hypothetical protein K0I63_07070 [Shewanella rhizosphaerae]|uniref:DUF7033 domain-containing protein n=1 Tax=Shewanella rhizosphaerae TaxID=2864207 RepID=UPI001C6624C1|nr:hypothetical protein [Shewanella rhizosphaerae]QYK14258.1 hypothetical protein K0I63_07070 [Shewanella rhizosphaerae]
MIEFYVCDELFNEYSYIFDEFINSSIVLKLTKGDSYFLCIKTGKTLNLALDDRYLKSIVAGDDISSHFHEVLVKKDISSVVVSHDLDFDVEKSFSVLVSDRTSTYWNDGFVNTPIFSLILYLLCILDEKYRNQKCYQDSHERFDAKFSILTIKNVIKEPVVYNLLRMFGYILQLEFSFSTNPINIKRKVTKGLRLTADLDIPFSPALNGSTRLFRRLAGDLILRRNPIKPFVTLFHYVFYKLTGSFRFDEYVNGIHLLKDVAIRNDNILKCYLILNRTIKPIDGDSDVNNEIFIALLKLLNSEKLTYGVHASYKTLANPTLLKYELSLVDGISNIVSNIDGVRSHFLRAHFPCHFDILSELNVIEDSTLYFHNEIGFRSGVNSPYYYYNIDRRIKTELIVNPIHVMDGTLINYIKEHGVNAGVEIVIDIIRFCKHYNTDFDLLWHNSSLSNNKERLIFNSVVNAYENFSY